MVTYADPKSKTTDPRPGVTVNQSTKSSGSTIAIIVAAIVVVIGAYMLFFNTPSTSPVVPSVTQNNTVLPAPDAVTPPPAPDAATPPAMETAPAAPAPATPPATAPVTP